MKKSLAISTIVILHALFIGVITIQAGCSSEPEKAPNSAKTTVEEIAPSPEEKKEVEDLKKEEAKTEVLAPEGSPSLRVSPTRPTTWQMGGAGQSEIVSDTSLEKVEPTKPEDNTVVAPKVVDKNLATYKVQKGDSLAKIAKKNKVSLNKLLEVNGMDRSSVIRIGQEISLPAPDPSTEVVPTVPTAPKAEPTNVETEELTTYIVKKGDYLGKIARKYKMSVKQLMAINNLKNHNIRIGQKLNVSKNASVATSQAETSTPATETKVAEGEVVHVVKSGETLGAIALKYGTSVKAIMQKNSIKDARKLRIGQKLVIVSKKAVEAPKPVEKPATQVAPTTAPTAPATPTVVEKPVVVEQTPVAPTTPVAPAVVPEPTVVPVAPVQPAAPVIEEL